MSLDFLEDFDRGFGSFSCLLQGLPVLFNLFCVSLP